MTFLACGARDVQESAPEAHSSHLSVHLPVLPCAVPRSHFAYTAHHDVSSHVDRLMMRREQTTAVTSPCQVYELCFAVDIS
jgi:hypothetical protein